VILFTPLVSASLFPKSNNIFTGKDEQKRQQEKILKKKENEQTFLFFTLGVSQGAIEAHRRLLITSRSIAANDARNQRRHRHPFYVVLRFDECCSVRQDCVAYGIGDGNAPAGTSRYTVACAHEHVALCLRFPIACFVAEGVLVVGAPFRTAGIVV